MPTTPSTKARRKKEYTLIIHCAELGEVRRRIKAFRVSEPAPFVHYEIGVVVTFAVPRVRTEEGVTIVQDNRRYVTVEEAGRVVFDSRTAVPCNMDAWQQTWEQCNGAVRSGR